METLRTQRYKELFEKATQLTELAFNQKERLAELTAKAKLTKAEKSEKLRLEKENEKTARELNALLAELPFLEKAAKAEQVRNIKAIEALAELDNEIIYIEDELVLVRRDDGTLAYCTQQEGTAELGDTLPEVDLSEFSELPAETQNMLISGYRKTWEKRAAYDS